MSSTTRPSIIYAPCRTPAERANSRPRSGTWMGGRKSRGGWRRNRRLLTLIRVKETIEKMKDEEEMHMLNGLWARPVLREFARKALAGVALVGAGLASG